MMKKPLQIGAALIAGAMSLTGQTLMNYEGFDLAGPGLTGSGSGSGFSGNWNVTNGNWNVESGSLSYGTLETAGNRIVAQTNGANIAGRGMSMAAPTSGEFWASAIVNSNGLGGGLSFDKAASTANLHLFSTSWGDRARFGFGINGGNFVYTLDGRSTSPVFGSVAGATGSATLLVAMFDVSNGLFSMWANPDIGGASPTGGILVADNVTFTRTGADFAGDVQTLGAFANWGGVSLDEIRLGTSFSVVSPVPEPSQYAMLLGIVGLAFVAWRRRRAN